MTCKEKDRDTCNVEKMSCEGCFYNRASNEEAEKLKEYENENWWNKEKGQEFEIVNFKLVEVK